MADALRSSADKGDFAATLKRSTGKDYVPAELVVGLKEGVTNSTRGLEKAAVAPDGQVKDELEDPKNRAVLMQFLTEQAARAARDELEKRPDVERNGIVEGQSVSSDPQVGYQWFHTVIRKTANLGTLSSTPPTIAVVDTGVDYNNPDLDGNVWTNPAEVAGNGVDDDNDGYIDSVHGHDFVNNDGDPTDDHYHGTAVAGLAAAEAGNGVGGEGVSPNSRILAIKVLDATNRGTCFTVAQGMAYARTANTTPLAKVINMSIAGPDCTAQSAEVNAI